MLYNFQKGTLARGGVRTCPRPPAGRDPREERRVDMAKQIRRTAAGLTVLLLLTGLLPVQTFAASAEESAVQEAARLVWENTSVHDSEEAAPASGKEYPEKFDLRAADFDGDGELENYVTPVKDQSPFGTCWGFAAVAAAETSILTELGKPYDEVPLDLSEHHLAWFTRTPLDDEEESQNGEGIYVPGAEEDSAVRLNTGGLPVTATSMFSSAVGPMNEADFPYRGKEGITVKDRSGNPAYYSAEDDWSLEEKDRWGTIAELEESYMLPSPASFVTDEETGLSEYVYNPAGTEAIKEQLMAGRPVEIAFCADVSMPGEISKEAYINPATWAHYTPMIYLEGETDAAANHAVTIIGWDDTYAPSNFSRRNPLPPGPGAWIVKNSWGAADQKFPNKFDWGINGYFYLSYYDHSLTLPESLNFSLDYFDTEGEFYIGQYDFLPSSGGSYVRFDQPASMANVFHMEDPTILYTLSFQTESPNTTTTFQVYKLNEDFTSPTDGELVYTQTKSYRYGGYHRANLEERIVFPADTWFSVVVTSRTADGQYEVVSDYHYSKLMMDIYGELTGEQYMYGVGVINPGESFLSFPSQSGETLWADWSDVVAQAEADSLEELEAAGLTELREALAAAEETYNAAFDAYYEKHPNADQTTLPAELRTLYADCEEKGDALYELLMQAEGGELNNCAMFVQDNFPITAALDPIYFTDVGVGKGETPHWAASAISEAQRLGLMSGRSQETFAPDEPMTRAMAVTALYAMAGEPETAGGGFPDVSPDAWYAKAAAWAAVKGITGGELDGGFHPDDPVTREELATFLYRFAASQGHDMSAGADLQGYADAGKISGYAVPAVRWAVASGLLGGTGRSMLDPAGAATRAQAASLLVRFYQETVE